MTTDQSGCEKQTNKKNHEKSKLLRVAGEEPASLQMSLVINSRSQSSDFVVVFKNTSARHMENELLIASVPFLHRLYLKNGRKRKCRSANGRLSVRSEISSFELKSQSVFSILCTSSSKEFNGRRQRHHSTCPERSASCTRHVGRVSISTSVSRPCILEG